MSITVEQFLEEEAVSRELIQGEVLLTDWACQPHEIVKSNFNQELGAYFKQSPFGRVMSGTPFWLGPHDAPVPDVSVVLKGRLQPGHSSLIPICPDIAIEVVSSETAKDLRAKIQLYLKHGARAVWVAYIELRMIQVYTGAGVRELTGDEPLEALDILPGFRVAAAAFFADL
jgi:Uma2 family endonuclease